jgi:hypothetical protein
MIKRFDAGEEAIRQVEEERLKSPKLTAHKSPRNI